MYSLTSIVEEAEYPTDAIDRNRPMPRGKNSLNMSTDSILIEREHGYLLHQMLKSKENRKSRRVEF